MYMIKSYGGNGSVSEVILENLIGHGNAYSLDIDQYRSSMTPRDRLGYEMMLEDWTRIPALVEDPCLNASGNWRKSLRRNPILAKFMSDFSSLIKWQ